MKNTKFDLIFRSMTFFIIVGMYLFFNITYVMAMQESYEKQLIKDAFDSGLIFDESVISKEISRLDAVCLLVKAFSGEDYGPVEVYNIRESIWFVTYIQSAKELGLVNEDVDSFLNEKISRQECFTLLAICIGVHEENFDPLRSVVDNEEISTYAKPYLAGLIKAGYLEADEGYINPKVNINLASLLEVIKNVFILRVHG